MSSKICEHCQKQFSLKQNCVRHEKTCRFKSVKQELEKKCQDSSVLLKQLEEKDEQLSQKDKQLQEKDEQIAFLKTILGSNVGKQKQGKTINNNINNNIIINNITTKDVAEFLEPIKFEEIKSALQDLNYKHIRKGMKGIAEYLCENALNGKIITTDSSRDILAYNTNQKKMIRDPKGSFLLNKTLRDNSEILLDKITKENQWMQDNQSDDEFEGEIRNVEVLNSIVKNAQKNKTIENNEFCNIMKKRGIHTLNKIIHDNIETNQLEE
jgi:hypothetical protein